MATKGKQEQEPAVEPEVKPEVEQVTEPETFTQEQQTQVEALITEAKEIGKAEAFEEYKGIQRTISAQDLKIKRLETERGQPRSGSPALKTLLEKLAKRGADSYEPAEQAEIGQLLSQYGQEEQQAAQQLFVSQKREELNQRITDAGLDPNDEQFDSVWDAYNFEEAERRVGRALSKAKPSEPAKEKEDDEQVRERIKREVQDELGLTKQPGNIPSGAGKRSYSAKEIGDMSYTEWVEAGRPDAKRE